MKDGSGKWFAASLLRDFIWTADMAQFFPINPICVIF